MKMILQTHLDYGKLSQIISQFLVLIKVLYD